MKKRIAASATLLIALLGLALYYRTDSTAPGKKDTTTGARNSSSSSTSDQSSETTALPTKVSDRPASPGPHATHRPDQLKQFYLPDVEIAGLPLRDALTKLQAAYDNVCRESGEVPIRLTFTIPPDATRPLTVKTGIRTLDGAIHLLAAMSGLKVSRTGSEYVFTPPRETGETVKKEFKLPPDFFSDPSNQQTDPFAETPVVPDGISVTDYLKTLTNKDADVVWTDPDEPAQLSPAEYFASKGITLDPHTKLTRSPNGDLQLETTSAADRTAIEGMIEVTTSEPPLAHQLQTRLIQIAAGNDWTPPDVSQLDAAEMTQLMRQLSQSKDVEIMTTPSTTSRTGQDAKVEIVRDVIFPPQTPDEGYRTEQAGVVVDIRPAPYGFGHLVDLNYSEKVLTEEGSNSELPKIVERTSINDSSFSGDGSSRMHVQTHPDGSRSIVFVTPTLIDATGRPLHPK